MLTKIIRNAVDNHHWDLLCKIRYAFKTRQEGNEFLKAALKGHKPRQDWMNDFHKIIDQLNELEADQELDDVWTSNYYNQFDRYDTNGRELAGNSPCYR